MGRFGWDHPHSRRTTLQQSMQYVDFWADVYMSTRDERETIDAKILTLREEVDEAHMLAEQKIYIGITYCDALQEANRLDVRRTRLNSFFHFFRNPENFLDGPRNPLGRMLQHVGLELENIPVREGYYASLRFLREVMLEVKYRDPKYEVQFGEPYNLLGAFEYITEDEEEENERGRQRQATKKAQASKRTTNSKAGNSARTPKETSPPKASGNGEGPSGTNPDKEVTPPKPSAWDRPLRDDEWSISDSLTVEEFWLSCGIDPSKFNAGKADAGKADANASTTGISSSAADTEQACNDLTALAIDSESDSKLNSCTSCMEDVLGRDMVWSACDHPYCAKCALYMLEESFKKGIIFPPRCCDGFLLFETKKHLFTTEIWARFELETTKSNDPSPLYCYDPRCSAYIPPQHRGACQNCTKKTCVKCIRAKHRGPCDLRGTDQDRQLKELALENSWRRCEGCGHMVELKFGCNHMTCVCGHEFCYKCGWEWKTCGCPQYGDSFVPERIDPRRDPNDPLFDPRRVCPHSEGWTRRPEDTPCAGCQRTKTYAVLECKKCSLVMCGPCRKNVAESRDAGHVIDGF
ncbi:unnamed protein product [Penicillium salamii]|nr:unnamed protein product [Penicillium salamii]